MLEQDYLMRLIITFFQAMRRSWEKSEVDRDPQGAADTLEAAIDAATDLDGAALLSLAPESIATVMQVSGVDPNVTEFVARGMLLESVYLEQAGQPHLASVRSAQAHALAQAYGFDLPEDPTDFDTLERAIEESFDA